jgi:hypothetical protein
MSRLDRVLGVLVFLAALTVYALTLTPSLSYLSPDGSELATVPYVLGLAHSPGYPLYTWLGWLFSHLAPLGDVAYRINLMSAVLGALAAGGVYWILIRLLPGGIPAALRRGAAALGALLLAFSKTFWAQSLIAEVYAPNAAGIVVTLLALLRWERTRRRLDFFLFALAFGLSLGLHLSDLGFAPAFLAFILLTLFDPADPAAKTPPTALVSKLQSLFAIGITGLFGFALGVAQFIWLPLRSAALNDRVMLRNAPATLAGIYNYTLGAFPNFKFAFALTALPDRLVIYLDLLQQQFGLVGIGLGILGLFSLLARRPRHFFLFVGMYLVQIWFFIQYSAFDLDVFFIPAHLLWALFVAFGVSELIAGSDFLWGKWARAARPYKTATVAGGIGFAGMDAVRPLTTGSTDPKQNATHRTGGLRSGISSVAAGCAMVLLSAASLNANWNANDFSGDTAVNDFYAGVWSVLPENAALITQSGVFGYDAFYWQLVYGTRSDVLLPMLPGPDASASELTGRDLYGTTRALTGNFGPGALPGNLLGRNQWSVPVLFGQQPEESFGNRETLVLYHLSSEPPDLAEENPQPQFVIDRNFGSMRLIGYNLSTRRMESGDVLSVKFYWRVKNAATLRVETALGGLDLEEHEVGFGLLSRYAQTNGLPAGSVISDSYGLIIPSGTAPGAYAFTIRAAGLGDAPGEPVPLGTVDVVNDEGTMERWLQIAES